MTAKQRASKTGVDRALPLKNASRKLAVLAQTVVRCGRCPELRAYCTAVATARKRAFADWTYWGRPVAGFGDPEAKIMIVGLAPAAHGANRTGRMFTGDRSGDFLYSALYRASLANQPTAVDREDGLELRNVYIGAAIRCAPPGNRPTPAQVSNCASYLVDEISVLRPAVLVCLGAIAWDAALRACAGIEGQMPKPRPRFGHGAQCLVGGVTMLGSYHVSQQNTFTGRLTPAMLDSVIERAVELAGRRPGAGSEPPRATMGGR